MNFSVVNDPQWTFPDVSDYPRASGSVDLVSPRNSFASAQILFFGMGAKTTAGVKISGKISELGAEIYELTAVNVEENTTQNLDNEWAGIFSRKAPFRVYDCLKPFDGSLSPENGTAGLYICFRVPEDAEPGVYAGSVCVSADGDGCDIPVSVAVKKACVPKDEHLKIINGFSSGHVAKYHGVESGSPEHRRLDTEYLKMLRRTRQNMLYTGGVKVEKTGENTYSFNFDELGKFYDRMSALGYKYFNMSSLGGRRSWHESEIYIAYGYEAMSYEAYRYLSQYLPALESYLRGRGIIDRFYHGVSDEPNDENATEFRALCGLAHRLAPGIKLIDALSYTNVHGALDVWVPLNASYESHREQFESFRTEDNEIWHYVCCGPRNDGYINRFTDYKLLSTRYLFYGNYKYDLGGYLHWAANCYQPGQDPFTQSCPEHHNADATCILPPGDTHIIYPGEGAPWMSMRLEAQRQSAEEYELLRLLSLSDRGRADALCAKVFRGFRDVEFDLGRFASFRAELLDAVSAL